MRRKICEPKVKQKKKYTNGNKKVNEKRDIHKKKKCQFKIRVKNQLMKIIISEISLTF